MRKKVNNILNIHHQTHNHLLHRTRLKSRASPLKRHEITAMDNANALGLIIGIVNIIPGIILALFYRPIGTSCANTGKKLCERNILPPALFEKLYEEKNSRFFVLALGLWLTLVGIVFIFLLPILITKIS